MREAASRLAGRRRVAWPASDAAVRTAQCRQARSQPSQHGHLQRRGIKDRITRRGIERNDRLGRHRWVVGPTHSWLASFGKLRTRFERRIDAHVALLFLACCVICVRTLTTSC
ncbi:transposase [Variovorax sp. PBL-E5]|uniref:transposase n=1 Tax=Variovorax sp. PBL-E5 TaxID=434014 RepID=UPI003FCEAB34